MNTKEFIHAIKGRPWVNRASSFDEVDCYGLIVLYYEHVLGVTLPNVSGYESNDCTIDSGWHSAICDWEEVTTPITQGLVFTCYKGDTPTHVGLVISPTHVLHSRGSPNHHGKVEYHSIRAIKSIYGKMTFHKFIGDKNA
tara:strand:+ start:19968 stop:20387 length:420 start_codon:yes stop_codon:yes gene_type:complete